MYKPPIEMIADQMRTEYENGALRLVQSYFPLVDKDELFKALNYDRNQYDIGYYDGVTDLAERLLKEFSYNWIAVDIISSVCKEMIKE